jgi:hypothetical protein
MAPAASAETASQPVSSQHLQKNALPRGQSEGVYALAKLVLNVHRNQAIAIPGLSFLLTTCRFYFHGYSYVESPQHNYDKNAARSPRL